MTCLSNSKFFASAYLVCLAVLLGCGQQGSQKLELTGAVIYENRPVEGGMIDFFPIDGGRPITVPFDEAGNYSVRLPAGSYQVAVVAPNTLPPGYQEGDPPPDEPPRIPPKYGHAKASGISVDVRPDQSPQVFDLRLD